MNSFQIVAILISLAAIFAFINHRLLKLHPTVGIMLQALLASLIWRGILHIWPAAAVVSDSFRFDLNEALFHRMLGGLLFAGAMRVNLSELKSQWLSVGVLSLAGTVMSTFIVAGLAYAVCRSTGIHATFGVCAVFGAVISPTDPVAVMGFLKTIDAPAEIEAVIGGESLFNDGVGVVLFTVLASVGAAHGVRWTGVPVAFLMQTVGGAGIGLAAGMAVYYLLRQVNNFQVEVLLTLALAMGGYTLADAVGVSGPIAAVVAGLIIGNQGRTFAMSDNTRRHLDDFWELVEETLNAVLFLLVGLVVLQMKLHAWESLVQLVAVLIVLFARWFSVTTCGWAVSFFNDPNGAFGKHRVAILTWGGLRGGLALAMALSLPASATRDLLAAAVFGVVVFSVLVQGSTLPVLFERWFSTKTPENRIRETVET
jgi:CPA1 family monovalent cation:H+ antiporter